MKQVTSVSVHLLTHHSQKAPIYRCIIAVFPQATCVVKIEAERSSQVGKRCRTLYKSTVLAYMQYARRKTPLEIHSIYLGNKINCIYKTCCKSSTDLRIFQFFNLFCSNNIHVFIKHVLEFKYSEGCVSPRENF